LLISRILDYSFDSSDYVVWNNAAINKLLLSDVKKTAMAYFNLVFQWVIYIVPAINIKQFYFLPIQGIPSVCSFQK